MERLARAYASLWLDIPAQKYLVYADFVVFPRREQVDGQALYTTQHAQPEWFVQLVPPEGLPGGALVMVSVNPENGLVDVHQLVQGMQYHHYGRDWPDLAVRMEVVMKEQDYRPFMEWSLVAKAAWSAHFRQAALSAQPGALDDAVRAFSAYAYGMPAAGMVDEKAALGTARAAARTQSGLDAQTFDRYNLTYTYLDVTDAGQPKWRFVFSAAGMNADKLTSENPAQLVLYRVEVDAWTGALLQTEAFPMTEQTGYPGLVRLM